MPSHLPKTGAQNHERQTAMFREAAEAPQRIATQFAENKSPLLKLGAQLRQDKARAVVTCARGSSDHAATFAKYLIETRLGLPTSSAAPSVASVYGAKPQLADTIFLAISQSGRSPDLIAGVEAAGKAGARTIALVNDTGSPLAKAAHDVIPLYAGPELSVAATKSCMAAFAAILHLLAEWAEDEQLCHNLSALPQQLERAWALDWSAAIAPLRKAQNLFVTGRGLGFAAAQEVALKLKETCAIHAEAISAAELHHGPMALVKNGFPVLIFSQTDRTRDGIIELADTLAAKGANLVAAGFVHPHACNLPVIEADPALQPLLAMMSFYRLANSLALARGLDPDRPPHLNKITETI